MERSRVKTILKQSSLGLISVMFALTGADWAQAFGISPPQVINDRLVTSAHYEQEITLSRADGEDEVTCNLDVNTPGFENWLTFEPGNSFVMAKGQKIAKLKILVDVPKDAKPGRNRGTIRITVTPKQQETGKINIVLGAQIDVDLTITSEKVSEMEIKQVKIPDLEQGWKILVMTRIENKGNTEIAPDKMTFDVYDSSFKNVLKSLEKNRLAKVPAFQSQEVLAFFQVPLPIGQYWGDVKVYKNGEVAWEEKAIFTVKEKGTLPPQPKEPFLDSLGFDPKWAAVGLFVVLAAVIAGIVLKLKKGKKKRAPKKN